MPFFYLFICACKVVVARRAARRVPQAEYVLISKEKRLVKRSPELCVRHLLALAQHA